MWIQQLGRNRESILGSADTQSLAAISQAYGHIEEMSLIPFDRTALVLIVLAAIVPLLPLIGTEIPLPDVMSKLAEFLI